MAKKHYSKPVLTTFVSGVSQPSIFDILDANSEIHIIIEKVRRLRDYLVRNEGISLEALGYAQGFLEVSGERLCQANAIRLRDCLIGGKDQGLVVVRIIEENSDLVFQRNLAQARSLDENTEAIKLAKQRANQDGSQN